MRACMFLLQGWRARGAQQDAASHVLGQDNAARRLPAGFADTAICRQRPSSWSAGVASRWSSSTAAAVPSPSSGRSSISSNTEQPACSWTMTNKHQQQQVPSRIAVPNLEISLGRQGWQHNLQDHHQQQQQRSGESTAPKELTLLKCL
ncbi:unnamed protein product [Miscanthus lutarioriparius]|uniref:Uncharacterized protein n=1 Tax=Miscanthus lutarioriparius TaxID=422564 RepID=A0A811MWC4_9POAL|nr:unnamed protein product [Miscanthus lutarioriparius]